MLALTIALAVQATLDNRLVRAAPASGDATAFAALRDSAAPSQSEPRRPVLSPPPPPAPPPVLVARMRPFAGLVGSCWRATMPDSRSTDTHCYTSMLGGRYIRDVHVVRGNGAPYSGETIYRWDPQARRVHFDYYASDGGYSSGFADPTPDGANFPEDNYVGGDGQTMVLRTVQIHRRGGYSNSSFARRPDGSWRELWTTHFTRVGPARPPR